MVAMNRGKPAAAEPAPPRCHFFEDFALVYWQLALPAANGAVQVDGVDVITFDADDRIAVKDAYRKAFG
jgi:hypothetical protein